MFFGGAFFGMGPSMGILGVGFSMARQWVVGGSAISAAGSMGVVVQECEMSTQNVGYNLQHATIFLAGECHTFCVFWARASNRLTSCRAGTRRGRYLTELRRFPGPSGSFRQFRPGRLS